MINNVKMQVHIEIVVQNVAEAAVRCLESSASTMNCNYTKYMLYQTLLNTKHLLIC